MCLRTEATLPSYDGTDTFTPRELMLLFCKVKLVFDSLFIYDFTVLLQRCSELLKFSSHVLTLGLRKYPETKCSSALPPTLLDTHTHRDAATTNPCLRLCFLYHIIISQPLLCNCWVCGCVCLTMDGTHTRKQQQQNQDLNVSNSEWSYLTDQKDLFFCELVHCRNICGAEAAVCDGGVQPAIPSHVVIV